jgi:hypothetical protein
MAERLPDEVNGYTVKEMIALVLLPEVKGLREDTDDLRGTVTGLTTQQGIMAEQLKHVATPETCPISHDVQELQVAVRRASHEGNANTTFRLQTKAIFGVVIFTISTISGMIAVFLAHVLT